MLVGIIDWALDAGVGLSKLVSLGNESGIRDVDVLEHIAKDPATSVIGMYLEELSDGRRFLVAVSRISRKKPIVILKAGASAAGQRAVAGITVSDLQVRSDLRVAQSRTYDWTG